MFYLQEILHEPFRISLMAGKKYKAFEFDNDLLSRISVLQAYYESEVHISASIEKEIILKTYQIIFIFQVFARIVGLIWFLLLYLFLSLCPFNIFQFLLYLLFISLSVVYRFVDLQIFMHVVYIINMDGIQWIFLDFIIFIRACNNDFS